MMCFDSACHGHRGTILIPAKTPFTGFLKQKSRERERDETAFVLFCSSIFLEILNIFEETGCLLVVDKTSFIYFLCKKFKINKIHYISNNICIQISVTVMC